MKKRRCEWSESHPLLTVYHDEEWGVPLHDDRKLFEFLVLEGAQAGLSWLTVLKKRDAYRQAFDGFDPKKVARYDARRVEKLLRNEGIIRNRLKVTSAIANARAFLAVQKEHGSFAAWMWKFLDGKPVRNAWTEQKQIPARTPLSDAISVELRKRGFRFVGSTIVYAHMQATGMVNDHVTGCFRYRAVSRAR